MSVQVQAPREAGRTATCVSGEDFSDPVLKKSLFVLWRLSVSCLVLR